MVFAKAGHDQLFSGRDIMLLGFCSGWTYIAELLFLASTLYFQSAAVPGRRNSISQPAQSPVRCRQLIFSLQAMQSRRNTIIRTVLILAVWTFCIYKIYIDFDHSYWFDDLIHKTLIVFASIVSLVCFYIDFRRYKKHKMLSAFISPTATCLSIIALFVTTDRLKAQDRIPTLFYAANSYSGLNSISIDFKKNGTYKCGKSIFFGDNYYTRGRYTIKDSVIYLDKSNLYNLFVSDKLLLKTIPQKDTAKKQGLIGLLFGLAKSDNSPEIFLFQIDNKGDTISSAIALRVNKDILTVRR
jgi:hypothetical protein